MTTQNELIRKLAMACENAQVDLEEMHDDAHGLECTDCEAMEETLPMLKAVSKEANEFIFATTPNRKAELEASALFLLWKNTSDQERKRRLWREYQKVQGWYTPSQAKAA